MRCLAIDDLLRERPRAVGMRIVGSPHHVALAKELDQVQSHQVRLVCRPHLALENLAREFFQFDVRIPVGFKEPLVAVVHLLYYERDPARTRLGQYELKLRVALEGAEAEKIDEGLEEGSCTVTETHIEG